VVRAAAPVPAKLPPGFGTASGRASAVYLVSSDKAPSPPSYENDGFLQKVEAVAGGWKVSVMSTPSPLKVRTPFTPGRLPSSLNLPPSLGADLARALAPCQRANEAVEAVLLTLKTHISYEEKPSFSETEQEVLKRGTASCVGMTRLAVSILKALGFQCREVVGLKLPAHGEPTLIQGGMLHACLEVTYPGAGTVFCDPFATSGWMPPSFIVLRAGGGLEVGKLGTYAGGTARCLEHEDRIGFEPEAGVSCLLWRRAATAAFTGNLLSGKFLGPLDAPEKGAVQLRGPGGAVSMDLWDGNFFFRDLDPGVYTLVLRPSEGQPQSAQVRLGPMDKRFLLFYSQRGAEGARPGAKP